MPDVFRWRPTQQARGKTTANVSRADFGDGYAQSVPNGINPWSRSWAVEFVGSRSEVGQIVSFLEAHAGRSFLWAPLFSAQGLYQCDEFEPAHQGGDVYTLSATFAQTFSP